MTGGDNLVWGGLHSGNESRLSVRAGEGTCGDSRGSRFRPRIGGKYRSGRKDYTVVCDTDPHRMTLQWREDLPADWADVPEQPPEDETEYVIEPLGNGSILLPSDASVEEITTQSYVYCDERNVASLGEKTA